MIFFVLIYVTLYTICLISIIYLIKTTFLNKITSKSLPHMVYYIVNFSKISYLYYGLITALTGIPPFVMFFIKFDMLIVTLGKFGFILFTILFIILFVNMIFYLQGIYLKNVEFSLDYINITKKKVSYKAIFIINFFLVLFYISIFFIPDIFLVSTIY